jgi:flagellar motor component MotA
LACTPDANIRRQEEVDALDEDERFTGSIINWQTADQIPAYGILFAILSLILVNGKAIADG